MATQAQSASQASAAIDFDKNGGVVAAIAVDHLSHRVLTVAYMNREAFEETVATGRACYFSRSRKKLWRKGEESGNFQIVHEIRIDCDADALVVASSSVATAPHATTVTSHAFFASSTTARGKSSSSAKSIPPNTAPTTAIRRSRPVDRRWLTRF